VNVLATAIEKTASTDPKKIRDAIASIQYEGVTGTIQFDDTGDSMLQPKIFTIRGNKYVLLWP
jgi:branched-chain amino acid transport system substrate-binding protein